MSDTPWPHFSRSELACKCCSVMKMDADFMESMEALRIAYGKPMTVTSAYRCPGHNAAVAHTGEAGPHTTGKAMDIAISGADAHDLLSKALAIGFPRVGLSQTGTGRFIHLDTLTKGDGFPSPALWTY